MRIKELRIENELTQLDVAKGIDTSQRNISRWENEENEPSSSFVIKLASFFGVSADYLLGLENDYGVKAAAPMGESYTAEERELIKAYRELPADSRKLVLRMVGVSSTSQGAKRKA